MTDQLSIIVFLLIAAGAATVFFVLGLTAPVKEPERKSAVGDLLGGETPSVPEGDLLAKYSRPMLSGFSGVVSNNLAPKSLMAKYEKILRHSGNPLMITPHELLTLQIVTGLIGFVLGLVVGTLLPQGAIPLWVPPLLFPLLFLIFPLSYHTSKVEARRKDVERNLPEALDLLQVVMSTGVHFQSALQKVLPQLSESFLKDELHKVLLGVMSGKSVAEALKDFERSNDSESADAFASAVHQAQALGAPLVDTLVRQARLIRANRTGMIEKLTAKLNSTLLLPALLFMLPAFGIILAAPAVAGIFEAMGGGF